MFSGDEKKFLERREHCPEYRIRLRERPCHVDSLPIAREWRNCGLRVDDWQIAIVMSDHALSEELSTVGYARPTRAL